MKKVSCAFCKKKTDLPHTCKFCGNEYCNKHILPEKHKCPGLAEWKKRKHTKVKQLKESMIYGSRARSSTKRKKPAKRHEDKKEEKKGCCARDCDQEDKLKSCLHCGKLFCKEHYDPRLPSVPKFKSVTLKSRLLDDEWRKPGGHPCPDYYDSMLEEDERLGEEYTKALNRMSASKKGKKRRSADIPYPVSSTSLRNWKQVLKTAIIFSIILVVVLSGFMFRSELFNFFDGILTVSSPAADSVPAPEIVEVPVCSAAFEHLNTIREENGLKLLTMDERLQELALYKAKDMYDRDYFDHKDPDGLCLYSYKQQFNIIEDGFIPDNLFMVDATPDPVDADCVEAIDSWMTSRGHKYNLLWPIHQKIGLNCYKNYCVFLGLTTGDFSKCSTGKEGLAFWETAPLQPFEK